MCNSSLWRAIARRGHEDGFQLPVLSDCWLLLLLATSEGVGKLRDIRNKHNTHLPGLVNIILETEILEIDKKKK